MDPSELKKLKNKQKKAKRKAEQEKATAQQAAARKELHNKSQKTKGDGAEDGDSAQKDELLPGLVTILFTPVCSFMVKKSLISLGGDYSRPFLSAVPSYRFRAARDLLRG